MPRQQKKIKKDDTRGVYIGVFHEAVEGTIKRAPQRDLCTLDEANFKITTKGKKKRSLVELQKYLGQLYAMKLRDLLLGKEEKAAEKAKGPKVHEVMQQWLDEVARFRSQRTVKDYITSINYYIEGVGDHPINDFKKFYNIDLKNYLDKAGLSTNTVYKHIANIQAFFNWAFEYELCPKVKLAKPIKTKKEPRIYSREQLSEIESILKDEIQNTSHKRFKQLRQVQLKAFTMARETAMRGGEIWSLLLENIKLDEGKILLRDNSDLDWRIKGKKEEWLPISNRLSEFLKQDLSTRKATEKWFLDDGSGTLAYTSEEKLARPFTEINKKLGIQGVKPLHGIRASVITHLLEDGVEITLVQKLARHSLITTTKGYQNTQNLPLFDAVNAISQKKLEL